MPLSFSQTASLTCPQCKTPFDADIWLIVDAGERRDLAARCHDGSIHVVTCLNNHSGMIAAPLLYHDRAKKQLFLAYPDGMSEQQLQQTGGQLIQQLRSQMLILPGYEYLDAPQAIPIELLPAAMDDKLDEVMAQSQAQAEQLRNDPTVAAALRILQAHRAISETIQEWMNLNAWNKSKQFLESHRELLSDTAELVLAAMLDLARARDDADMQTDVTVHLEISRTARILGIDAAYKKYLERSASNERTSEARAELDARLAELNLRSQADLERALPDHPELHELMARVMREENPIWRAIEKLLGTRSPQEVLQLARAYPLLLEDEGLKAIREFISNARSADDEGTANHLQARLETLEQFKSSGLLVDEMGQQELIEESLDNETRTALAEMRALGISNEQELESIFEQQPHLRTKLDSIKRSIALSRLYGNISEDTKSILQKIDLLTSYSELPHKIELYQTALERFAREENPLLWAMLNADLATALSESPVGDRAPVFKGW
ncbi:hypothetical protein FBQ82_00515 [Anaerolineae bacterium CFX7]|nr:hypothetical protein [Anaerolineae bacterium CFX7]